MDVDILLSIKIDFEFECLTRQKHSHSGEILNKATIIRAQS